MSSITEMVLWVEYSRDPKKFEEPLPEGIDHRRQSFRPLNAATAGGSKFFTSSVLAAAFNYVGTAEVKAWVASLCEEYDSVVLAEKYENGSGSIWTSPGWSDH